MFSTYDEADELRFRCSVCDKHKLEIIGRHTQSEVSYSLERCRVDSCTDHCHGHEVSLEVVVDLDDSYDTIPVIRV